MNNKTMITNEINIAISQTRQIGQPTHIYAGERILEILEVDEDTNMADGIDLKIQGYANATNPLHIAVQDYYDTTIYNFVFDYLDLK